MAQVKVQLPDDSGNTGKNIEHQSLTTSGYYREGMYVGDPATDAAIAPVKNSTPATNDYGLVVRDPTAGDQTDAAVVGDNNGSLSAKLRGLSKILNDVWDSVNHWFKVSIQNSSLAVTQSGTWTVQPGNTANSTAWLVTGTGGVFPATQSGTWTVQPGNTANTTPWLVQDSPAVSGGYSATSFATAASNNSTSLKGSAGQLYGVHIYNNANYPIYVKFYDKATAPAPATDNALLVRRIGVQAGTHVDVMLPMGVPFTNGIGYAIVKDVSDTGNTSVAANDGLVDIEYK